MRTTKVNTALITAILAGMFYGPQPTGNEEHYLGLARQWANPGWLPGSFSFNEFPGARLVYQALVGFPLGWFGFEAVVLVGKAAVIACTSYLLARLFSLIGLGVYQVGLLMAAYLAHQSFIGNHHMLTGLEAKHLAYIFVLLFLINLHQAKHLQATLSLIAATWLHVLVGGWAFVYFAALLLIQGNTKALRLVGLYAAATLPLALYLLTEINPVSDSVDWIYANYRNAHHTLTVVGQALWIRTNLPGIILSGAGAVYLWGKGNNLARYGALLLAGTAALAVLPWIDGSGSLIKYLPYRVNTVGTLLLFAFLATEVSTRRKAPVLIAAIGLLAVPVLTNLVNQYRYVTDAQFREVCRQIRETTPPDVVLLDLSGQGFDERLDLERRTERAVWVTYKFVPAGTGKTREWYRRVERKRAGEIAPEVDYVLRKENGIYFFNAITHTYEKQKTN